MYFDAQKKRWVLRGQIYDDDNKTSQGSVNQEGKELPPPGLKQVNPSQTVNKPVCILPPKMSAKPTTSSSGTVFTPQASQQSQPVKEKSSSTITNPFAVIKPATGIQTKPQLAKPPQKPNLTSRYTSIIDYDQ